MRLLRHITPLRFWRALQFLVFYLLEIVKANLRIAYDIVTPRNRFRPGIIRVPLPELTDVQCMVLTNLVTMTPGTLSLELTEDKRTLYLHSMYIDYPELIRREIYKDYISRIKEIV